MKAESLSFDDLTETEKESVSNNGSGKEWAGYIRVYYDNGDIELYSDAMEPEDATFSRDLSWVIGAINGSIKDF